MTDQDLFYCGDFQCDGHARSTDTCRCSACHSTAPDHVAYVRVYGLCVV